MLKVASKVQCLKAELRRDVRNVISMVMLMDGEEKHFDVPFHHIGSEQTGGPFLVFDFPVEVRRMIRMYKEPTDLLMQLSNRVAKGEPVTLPMTLLDLPPQTSAQE